MYLHVHKDNVNIEDIWVTEKWIQNQLKTQQNQLNLVLCQTFPTIFTGLNSRRYVDVTIIIRSNCE